MQLFVERGYDGVTVAEIAQRAGLTSRTFFRHFADKREVLFAGSEDLTEFLVRALGEAPPTATPMQAVAAALDAVAQLLGANHEFSRRRQSVIKAHAELRERERTKMASLSAAIAEGLLKRGVDESEAALAAEAGIMVFRVAFERWTSEPAGVDLRQTMRDVLDQLKRVTSG
jgi:AcrR family transcriptional regulator